MLTKLEAKSCRVKGLSFHPNRPWILASLHSGVIQLWDYRMGHLMERFEGHQGPVRGICFHDQQPLFVSGGDDYKVKVWNYVQKRCSFTLRGHMDYVRSTQFHHRHPWIASASDDETVRIWNWQSRTCICVIAGHSHYVMCANFHPSDRDLLVTASLDCTVRVWDLSGLVKKQSVPGLGGLEERVRCLQAGTTDLFACADVVVKYVLEGHTKGVNWASFHPTYPLVVSGGDDRHVKFWKMDGAKAWEVDTLLGHYGNVSSVLFHPQRDLLVSNSEDKSIRVWEVGNSTCVQTFRRDQDRFWTLACHPKSGLLAAGHDRGLVVFKLWRERPAFDVCGNTMLYVNERWLKRADFKTSTDVPIMSLMGGSYRNPIHRISYNRAEDSVLVSIRNTANPKRSEHDLYKLPSISDDADTDESTTTKSKRHWGLSAVWVSRNRFAILDGSHQLVIENVDNGTRKQVAKMAGYEEVLYAGSGRVLLSDPEQVTLYDVQREREVAQVKVNQCRYAVWSADMKHVALLAKRSLTICGGQLELLCTVVERNRVKSGSWIVNSSASQPVFIYTTSAHIKYVLTNGDYGIIRTLSQSIYITRVDGTKVFCLDRHRNVKVFTVDPTEYRFKICLLNQNYREALHMVKNCRLVGSAIVAYLIQRGHPEIAMRLVKNVEDRFALALESGKIEVALDAAKCLNDASAWNRLAKRALWAGNLKVVEMCYQQTRSFYKLSFLYLITGQLDKLRKVTRISEIGKDWSAQYRGALLLGDVRQRVKILKDANMTALADVTSATHGLADGAGAVPDVVDPEAKLLNPPPPVQMDESNWPLLDVEASTSGRSDDSLAVTSILGAEEEWEGWEKIGDGHKKNDDDLLLFDAEGWCLEDAELLDVVEFEMGGVDRAGDNNSSKLPDKGLPAPVLWKRNSQKIFDHVAAGSYDSARHLMTESLGIVNFEPFGPIFDRVYSSSRMSLTRNLHIASSFVYLQEKRKDSVVKLPLPSVTFDQLAHQIVVGYGLTTNGKFTAAIAQFRSILLQVPLLVADSEKQYTVADTVTFICRSYINGLQMETARKTLTNDARRQCEMAAYLTHCDLKLEHDMLTLRMAIKTFLKAKNYKGACGFGRRLLKLVPSAEVVQRTNRMLEVCGPDPADEMADLRYDAVNPFWICGYSYVAIYKGGAEERCPFCESSYLPKYKGHLCNVCRVAEIGRECSVE